MRPTRAQGQIPSCIDDTTVIGCIFISALTSPAWLTLSRELGVGFYLGYAELASEAGAEVRYNTPVHNAPAPEHDDLSLFHNELSMQAGAYQNGTWVAGVAKAGVEEGVDSIGGSCIIAPSGEVVARCLTKGDEVAIARCDLDFCAVYKRTTFNFDLHRQPHAYGLIVERKGETLAADGSLLSAPPSV